MKDNSLIQKLGKGMKDFDATHHSELFEHCVCPSHYFGIQCEHKLEICPGGDHVCLHGSQCVAHGEGGTDANGDAVETTRYTCDCDSAFDALDKYAGKFCQYQSTDICTKNGQPGMGKANFAFCVNNGICRGRINDGQDPPGCDCPEGFTGDHCEYLADDENDYDDDYDYDDQTDAGGFPTNHGKFNGGNGNGDNSFSSSESGLASNDSSSLSKRGRSQNLVIGLSAAVIVLVAVFIGLVVNALLYPGSIMMGSDKSNAADVQAALDEEEAASATTTSGSNNATTGSASSACTSSSTANPSGVRNTYSGDSLEEIDIVDYVSNNSILLSDREITNVQVV